MFKSKVTFEDNPLSADLTSDGHALDRSLHLFSCRARRSLLLNGGKQRVCGPISRTIPLQVGESLSQKEIMLYGREFASGTGMTGGV